MAYVRIFARSRAIRLLAALCAVSALAFVLGQGAAALRENLIAERQPTAQSQILERVTGAQGAARPTSTPSATGVRSPTAKPVKFSTNVSQPPKARPLTPQPPLKPEDKHHHSHKKAAGDASHGGLSHQKGDKRHKDSAQQGAQGKQKQQDQQGKQSQQGVGASND